MQLDPAEMDRRYAYRLLTACVIPRPVGWISTLSATGAANLAPFSFFGGVTSDPPTVMISVGRRKGEHKDTARNLLDTKEAVVHIAHRALASQMVATSAEVAADVDEFDLAGLSRFPGTVVKPFRIVEAAIAMECQVVFHQEVGNGPVDLFLLEIVRFHLDDRFLQDGLPDASKLAAVGRLGGAEYCDTTKTFAVERPGGGGRKRDIASRVARRILRR